MEQRKILARFRAKKSYLIRKKGLTEAEAVSQAKHILEEVSCQKINSTKYKNVEEPSSTEIRNEVERQKALGIFTEVPLLMSNSEKKLKVKELSKELPTSEIAAQSTKIMNAAFYALIVAIASWLLISSSLEVFGNGSEGWGKAIILELGILGLAVSKTKLGSSLKEIAGFLLSKATLIFLVFLSFSVLHTGVESQRSEGLTTAESTSTIIADLISERDDWQKTYDDYAENRISDRRDALKKISRLNAEIKAERAAISKSLDGSVINLKSNTEKMIRAALLLLNIIFGHKLAQAMATIKWPPLQREEKLKLAEL